MRTLTTIKVDAAKVNAHPKKSTILIFASHEPSTGLSGMK